LFVFCFLKGKAKGPESIFVEIRLELDIVVYEVHLHSPDIVEIEASFLFLIVDFPEKMKGGISDIIIAPRIPVTIIRSTNHPKFPILLIFPRFATAGGPFQGFHSKIQVIFLIIIGPKIVVMFIDLGLAFANLLQEGFRGRFKFTLHLGDETAHIIG